MKKHWVIEAHQQSNQYRDGQMAYLLFRAVVMETVWDVVVDVVEFQMGTLRLALMVDYEFFLQIKGQ
eukprot:13538884-Ditylum_brightwellii.AAC.1